MKMETIICPLTKFYPLCFITVLAISVIKPFKDTLSYKDSNCMTYDKKYNESLQMSCSCGGTCLSTYPCVKVYVWYFTEEGENITSMLQESGITESVSITQV